MRKTLALCFAILIAAPLAALADESPFYGRAGLELAWISTNDRFDAYADIDDPDNPDADPSMDSRLQLIPLIDIGAHVESLDSTLYIATPFRAPGLPLAVGLNHRVKDGTGVDISVFSVLDRREWRDPYVASKDRKQSKVINFGARLDLAEIAGSAFGVTGQWQSEKVVDDDLADRSKDLNRTGKAMEVAVRYDFPIGGGFKLVPVFGYERGDFNGEANSYRGWSAELNCSTESENFAMNANAGYGMRDYSKKNPIYNDNIEEKHTSFGTLLTWKKPAGVKSLFIDVHAALDLRDANISYHDAETWLLGISASLGF